jgi:protein-tyrosine-phosphatase
VIEGAADGYAIAVMQEMGVDVSTHEARSFDSLFPSDFDRIISFSAEAHESAVRWASKGCKTELWVVHPPHLDERAREATLESYRELRDQIAAKLKANFGAFVQKT